MQYRHALYNGSNLSTEDYDYGAEALDLIAAKAKPENCLARSPRRTCKGTGATRAHREFLWTSSICPANLVDQCCKDEVRQSLRPFHVAGVLHEARREHREGEIPLRIDPEAGRTGTKAAEGSR